MTGIVKIVNYEKKFGFIRPDGHGIPDHFFHASGCDMPFSKLEAGAKVEFVSLNTERGKRAEDVRLCS